MFDLHTKLLKIISCGGFGTVTENLFVYQFKDEMIIVDCGTGFSRGKEGDDVILPDYTYLYQNASKIKAIILTHGHEDHIGGLPYLLPRLGANIPVYGSRLTMALVGDKLAENGVAAKLVTVDSNSKLNLGSFFVEFVYVTHSVPETFNLYIKTPVGNVFHASDFKFDLTPPAGPRAEFAKISAAGERGVDLLLSDCLRSEKWGYTLSESMLTDTFEREISGCKGKFLVTTMSSNVSRWKQAIDVLKRHQRKIVLAGRSVEKIIDVAYRLGYIKVERKDFIFPHQIKKFPPSKIGILVSGSQAQTGSALERISTGDYQGVKVIPGDKIVISSDYIPGNELAIHGLIDDFSRLGADVSYSEILDDLHVSGHAAQQELLLMLAMTRPKNVLPIGGAYRQMKQYGVLARRIGVRSENILLPTKNQIVELHPGGRTRLGEEFVLKKQRISSQEKQR